jgi:hydrogenase maturation protease
MTTKAKTTLVVGLGQTGCQDAAVGLHVVQALKQSGLPEHVELLEGSDASDLPELLTGREQIIIVDAADFQGPAGRFVELEAPEFLSDQVTMRHADIRRTIALMFLRSRVPRKLTVIGVIPSVTEAGPELTEKVKQQVPAVVSRILEKIRNSRA